MDHQQVHVIKKKAFICTKKFKGVSTWTSLICLQSKLSVYNCGRLLLDISPDAFHTLTGSSDVILIEENKSGNSLTGRVVPNLCNPYPAPYQLYPNPNHIFFNKSFNMYPNYTKICTTEEKCILLYPTSSTFLRVSLVVLHHVLTVYISYMVCTRVTVFDDIWSCSKAPFSYISVENNKTVVRIYSLHRPLVT